MKWFDLYKPGKNKLVTIIFSLAVIYSSSFFVYGAELKSYSDESLGFSLKYPESWSVKKPVSGEGIIIEQKGDDYIQAVILVTKNVRDEGNPFEEVKQVMVNSLKEKGIEPVKSWTTKTGIASQYCSVYEEKVPIIGLSNITECSSLANEIYYKTKVVTSPELYGKYSSTIETLVNSFEIKPLSESTVAQNRVDTASKAAGNTFIFSLLKWLVIFAVGGWIYKKVKRNKNNPSAHP